jgi:hypothetical protein
MNSKTSVAVMLAIALVAASMRLPAAACTASTVACEKACELGCCANKNCCETSQKKTPPPVQPLAQSVSDQQNIATLASTVSVTVFDQAATQLFVFSSADFRAHSLAPFALICIRLI